MTNRLPYFDSVADAERRFKTIITDALDGYEDLDIYPSPAGEVRVRYRRTHAGPYAHMTIKLRTEHE